MAMVETCLTNNIEIRNLTVAYGRLIVLRNINLKITSNEFVAIVGKSGGGKSTLLNALAGFIPFSGDISRPEHIGLVFQQQAVFPWLTVAENIAFGVETGDATKRQDIVREHIRLAGLETKTNCYPAQLSGGQIQRLALARTLANNPDVLLMDEPYGSLDAHTREEMQRWLLEIWSEHKKTVVFITHDIAEALFLADRILLLDNGRFANEIVVPFNRPRSDEIKFSQEFNELNHTIHGWL